MAKRDEQPTMAPAWESDDHRQVLQRALGRLTQAEGLHNQLVPNWIENYRAFRAMPARGASRDKADWQSDVRNPYVAEQVLTMQPRLVEGRPSVDVALQDPTADRSIARMQRQYLTHTLWQDEYPMKAARRALNTILFGIGWTKQSYLHQRVWRDVVNRSTGEVENTPLTIAARPTMGVPHPIDALWDPTAVSLETARYVILRTMTTVGQVHAQRRRKVKDAKGGDKWVGRYENVDEVKPWGRRHDHQFPNQQGNDIPELPGYMAKRCEGKVELLEVLDKESDTVTAIANRQVVIRHHKMPWWHGELPVAAAVTTPDVGTLHGIPEVDWIRPMQEMLHLLENQRLDNTRLQMDMILLVRDTLLDFDDYQLEPGAKWPVERMDDVQVLQYPQPQLASMGDIELLRGRLQAIIGSAFMTGGDAGAMGVNQETASGLMSIIEEGNRRVDFRMNLMRLADERALRHMHSDAAQFLDEPQFVPGSTRGEDPIQVTPEALAAKSWVRVTMGSDTGLKSLRQQMAQGLLMAAQAFKGTPLPQADGKILQFNETPLVEILAEAYDREPEEFMFDAQAMMAAQAANDPAAQVAAQQAAEQPTSVQMPGAAPALPAGPVQ